MGGCILTLMMQSGNAPKVVLFAFAGALLVAVTIAFVSMANENTTESDQFNAPALSLRAGNAPTTFADAKPSQAPGTKMFFGWFDRRRTSPKPKAMPMRKIAAQSTGGRDSHGCQPTLPPQYATFWDAASGRCVSKSQPRQMIQAPKLYRL